MKILCVAGARPNFMKIAPILNALDIYGERFEPTLLHTGQHYDYKMSQVFFNQLGIKKPDVFLNVGSGSHAQQTAQIMAEFEKVVLKMNPDIVLVVGDVNSTAACALVAKKLNIRLAHVEAGLRSFDRTMPEEINRLVTDSITDIFYTTSEEAGIQLLKEGHHKESIIMVGNCMIDTLKKLEQKADRSDILLKLNLKPREYALMTLHRPSNVDDLNILSGIVDALVYIESRIPVVCPLHPRTKKRLEDFGLMARLDEMKNFITIEPEGYLGFVKLMKNAKFVVTDSGGLQEETTVLGIPCLTLRNNTERPETITLGTNILTGVNKANIIREADNILRGNVKKGQIPKFWDGKASERIAKHLAYL